MLTKHWWWNKFPKSFSLYNFNNLVLYFTSFGYGEFILLQVDFDILGIKDAYKVILSLLLRMIKHSQSTQSNKFAISLQYLKKEVKKVYFFHADEHQSLLFLMEVARYVQSTQNRKFIIFLKRVLQLLLCSIVMQNIQIFYGALAMFIVTCFLAQPDYKFSAWTSQYNK